MQGWRPVTLPRMKTQPGPLWLGLFIGGPGGRFGENPPGPVRQSLGWTVAWSAIPPDLANADLGVRCLPLGQRARLLEQPEVSGRRTRAGFHEHD
jgi:hypothetical protein